MHAMPTEMEQYDTLVANLKQQLARGGMSYAEAVIVDDIISILVGRPIGSYGRTATELS